MEQWLDRLRREIEEATRGFGEAEWRRAPQGRWNSAQIVEHLGRTYGGTAKMLERSLSAQGNTAGKLELRAATMKERVIQFLVVSMGRFPSGQEAPAFALPEGNDAGPEALHRALGGLERMRTALAAAEQRWGSSRPVGVHVALGPMNAAQWRKFHYVHGHHHVRQILERSGSKAVA
jgi:hypothetical protein